MSNFARGIKAYPEPIREVAFGSITSSYAAFGNPLVMYARILFFSNSTNADVYISLDGVANHFRIYANSYKSLDVATNKVMDDEWYIGQGTQFYIKYASAPSSGQVSLEIIGSPAVWQGNV